MQKETHPLRTSVPDLVEGLQALENDTITKSRVAEFLTACPVNGRSADFLYVLAGGQIHSQSHLPRRLVRSDGDLLGPRAENSRPHAQWAFRLDEPRPGRDPYAPLPIRSTQRAGESKCYRHRLLGGSSRRGT
jgi:hypothetical protein